MTKQQQVCGVRECVEGVKERKIEREENTIAKKLVIKPLYVHVFLLA